MDILPDAPVVIWGLPGEGFNVATLYNSWLVMVMLVVAGVVVTRRLQRVPGRLQMTFELLVEFFDDVCTASLGEELGKKFVPFIVTLFLFTLLTSIITVVPNFLAWAGWPGFDSPTQDLNTTLSLAIIVFFIVHISAIRANGLRGWLWGFYEPDFPMQHWAGKVVGALFLAALIWLSYFFAAGYVGGFAGMDAGTRVALGALLGLFLANNVLLVIYSIQLKRVPNVPMAPLNVVGELGKAISHPFRLFGNIFGGFVIVIVISELILYIGLPPFLDLFFNLFIALVHAFVFTMLAIAYTAVQVHD